MKFFLLPFCLLLSFSALAWVPQTGDIIFQTSRSAQSKAIQMATKSHYSHMGMIVVRNRQTYVFEAIGPVKYTALQAWIGRGENGSFIVRRVKGGLSAAQRQKLTLSAKRYLGKPYDLAFSWTDERQYCSEVVWKVYRSATGMRIGKRQKLKEFDLHSKAVRDKLTERYGKNIPLEETVISPQAMFDDPRLETVKKRGF